MSVKNRLKWQIRKLLIDHYPKLIIDHEWPAIFGHPVDWDNPKDLNEKIQWLICYSDTSEWTRLTDKVKVREFVEERGYGHLLTRLYGVWENAEDIDYEENQFDSLDLSGIRIDTTPDPLTLLRQQDADMPRQWSNLRPTRRFSSCRQSQLRQGQHP